MGYFNAVSRAPVASKASSSWRPRFDMRRSERPWSPAGLASPADNILSFSWDRGLVHFQTTRQMALPERGKQVARAVASYLWASPSGCLRGSYAYECRAARNSQWPSHWPDTKRRKRSVCRDSFEVQTGCRWIWVSFHGVVWGCHWSRCWGISQLGSFGHRSSRQMQHMLLK